MNTGSDQCPCVLFSSIRVLVAILAQVRRNSYSPEICSAYWRDWEWDDSATDLAVATDLIQNGDGGP